MTLWPVQNSIPPQTFLELITALCIADTKFTSASTNVSDTNFWSPPMFTIQNSSLSLTSPACIQAAPPMPPLNQQYESYINTVVVDSCCYSRISTSFQSRLAEHESMGHNNVPASIDGC
ncbi:hypothetical protein C5167_016408 [Papaver somniferum]|nr:hypothetical protein C5167_016408 [Papaver somniferum]